MKKFFIFLFAVFLATFIGCKTGFGGSSEIPDSGTDEEITEKTTVETDGEDTSTEEKPVEETFEVFALESEEWVDIKKVNDEFNFNKGASSEYVTHYFYKKIKINNTVYTVKNLVKSGVDNRGKTYYSLTGSSSDIKIYTYNNNYEYYFNGISMPLSFIDFIGPNKKPICFIDYNITISFSDLYELYEEVK